MLFFKDQLMVKMGRKTVYTVNIVIEVWNQTTNLIQFTLFKLQLMKIKTPKDFET